MWELEGHVFLFLPIIAGTARISEKGGDKRESNACQLIKSPVAIFQGGANAPIDSLAMPLNCELYAIAIFFGL